ncbi:MAG: 4Fe-4S dicluster domain-containing protein [Firmicutes bacterium]|jgi:ferredoxin|nr:4Fe-4S dicluster domain-containing protein [Bacillota bacterium]
MKLFYFTATGNSLSVAKSFGGENISMAQYQNGPSQNFEDESIGFIFPCYGSSFPTIVEQFIEKHSFKSKYTFAIITYGSMTMGAEKHFVDFAKSQDIKIDYINKIKMLDNSLKFFNIEKEIKKLPKKNVDVQLDKIKSDIKLKKHTIKNSNFIANHLSKKGFESYRKEIGDCDNLYTVESHCTKCGVCEKVCPVSNITVDNKVKFKGNCLRCYACTHNCPANAIRFKNEKSKRRFRNEKVSLKEIIESNNQNNL